METRVSGGFGTDPETSRWAAGQAVLTVGVVCLNIIPILVPFFENPVPILFAGALLALLALILIYVGMSRILYMYRQRGEVKDFGDAVDLVLQYIVGTEIIILLLAWMLSDVLAAL